MLVLALVAAVLVTAGPAQVQAQQECVTPSGFIGRCRFGLCPLPNGGPSPVCERGYSCCVHVSSGRPSGGTPLRGAPQRGSPPRGSPPRRRRPTLATAAPPRRRTLLNPQFECGGQPAPERMMTMDPSAIVFPRTRRQAPEPTPKPDKSIAFVAGGAPEPGKTAVGVGVIGPRNPSRPSIQDVLERIGSRPKPPRRAPSFQGLSVSAPAPPPPPPPPSSSGRRGGGGSFFNTPSQSSSRRGSGGGGFFNLFSQPDRPNSIRRNPPRRRNNFQPNRNFNRRRGRGYGRQNYYQPRRYYNNRRPRRYHNPPRNYHDNYQQTYYQPPRRAYNQRPRRGLLDQVLSIFGLSPQRGRRYRRSPQSPAEADSFETVWQEYQERVRSGDAPAGYTREELLEAYRAAAAEAAAESGGDTGNGGGWTCGAVLISERYMLTAAHCLLAGRPQVVRLGDLNLTSSADGAPQEYLVQEVIPHPRYKHPLVYHDLALLRLDRTVTFSEFVKPFCLFDGRSSLVDRVSHVSGWGATEFGGDLSDVLMGGNVTIWSQPRCDAVYTRQPGFLRRLPDGITSDLLCAGGEEQDACQGDSGGPMTVLTERGTRLAGVVSAGIGCASPGIPGLYTNVANYIDWIDSVVYGDGAA